MDARKKIGLFTAIAGAALVASSLIGGTASAHVRPMDLSGEFTSHNTDGWATDCDDTEWHWIITGLTVGEGETLDTTDVPATITVSWSDGDVTAIPLTSIVGSVAHYFYYGHLDGLAYPTGASATWPAGTEVDSYNNFNLSHGLCEGTEDTEPEETTPETTPDTSPDTTQVGSEGPTTTTAGSSGGELPQTGSEGLALTVGLVLLGLGAVLATLTRRSAAS